MSVKYNVKKSYAEYRGKGGSPDDWLANMKFLTHLRKIIVLVLAIINNTGVLYEQIFILLEYRHQFTSKPNQKTLQYKTLHFNLT